MVAKPKLKQHTQTTQDNAKEPEFLGDFFGDEEGNVIETLVKWTVNILTLPFAACGYLLEQFVSPQGAGVTALGAAMFTFGVCLGADSYWQMFGNTPIFPWYEVSGMQAWRMAILPLNPLFWLCIIMSMGITVIQGKAVRGHSISSAKEKMNEYLVHNLPEKPGSNKIDAAKVAWKQYKRAGVNQARWVGLISLAFWAFEVVSSFHAHWPLGYTSPGDILGCFLYVIFKILSGEIGYQFWIMSRQK